MAAQKPSDALLFSLWLSQFLSLIGSDVTKFVLRVWSFQNSGSVSQFTFLSFCTEAPGILLSPFFGLVIDRFPRRTVLVVADVLGAICTSFLLLYGPGPWLVFLCNVLSAVTGAIHWAAFTSSAKLLMPPSALIRFGGFVQFAPALSMLVPSSLVVTHTVLSLDCWIHHGILWP